MTHQTRGTASQQESNFILSVDLERCVKCGKCEKVCPTGAIMVDEDIFRVDSSRCNGCRRCIEKCRQEALSLRNNGGEPFGFEPRIELSNAKGSGSKGPGRVALKKGRTHFSYWWGGDKKGVGDWH
jgi:Fe-S-cluster-containing hydrogenase component 2